jgi:hypothetical protein
MADDVLTTDAQAALGTPELGPQGPTPKPGQAVPPTDALSRALGGTENILPMTPTGQK